MPNKVFKNASKDQPPTLGDVAELLRSGKAKRVVLLAGAGISTSAGIPDFRSPKTGLYANLRQYNLPYPEAIFDISFFKNKPQPFFALAKELYPGHFQPTITHCFFRLLHKKGLLQRCFTQNIDTLERMAGLDDRMIVEAHGSFASAKCLRCRQPYSVDDLRPRILKGEVVRCTELKCKGKKDALVKPDIVFFGEGLPGKFFDCAETDFDDCDLLIVLGTSLKVHPFAGLVDYPPNDCPRVLINLEPIDGGGVQFDFKGKSRGGQEYARDVAYLGACDEGIRQLARDCGWLDELEAIYEDVKARHTGQPRQPQPKADAEVEKLAKAIGEATLGESAIGGPTEAPSGTELEPVLAEKEAGQIKEPA